MAIKASTIIANDSILKIEIDHVWTSINFLHLFDSITRLYAYNFHLVRSLETLESMGKEYNWGKGYKKFPKFNELVFNFRRVTSEILQNPYMNDYESGIYVSYGVPLFRLQIRKITFGSKGSVDLFGVGKIFEIITDLIKNYLPNEREKLDNLIKAKEIEEREQKILQIKIQNLKTLGYNSDEIRSIIGFESFHINRIKELINKDMINDLKIEKHSEN